MKVSAPSNTIRHGGQPGLNPVGENPARSRRMVWAMVVAETLTNVPKGRRELARPVSSIARRPRRVRPASTL